MNFEHVYSQEIKQRFYAKYYKISEKCQEEKNC